MKAWLAEVCTLLIALADGIRGLADAVSATSEAVVKVAAARARADSLVMVVMVVSCLSTKGGMPFDGQEHTKRRSGALCWPARKCGFRGEHAPAG
jgi:hypothetical protein